MTCAELFSPLSLLFYCIFHFSDGQECGSIRWPHIKMAVLFLMCFMKKKASHLSLIFPLPRLQITLAPPRRLIPLGERRKRGQLHLWLLNKCITVWVLCPGLSGPLTWNVPMRQSGAIGAWQLAAGRDNLLWGTKQRVVTDFPPMVDAPLNPWDLPIQREPCDKVAGTMADF